MKPRIPLRQDHNRSDSPMIRGALMTGTVRLVKPTDKAPTLTALRTAWREHSAELLRACPAGCRPWGWWRFSPDSPCRFELRVQTALATRDQRGFGEDSQAEILAKAGLLRPGEKEEAEKRRQAWEDRIHERAGRVPVIQRLRAGLRAEAAE